MSVPKSDEGMPDCTKFECHHKSHDSDKVCLHYTHYMTPEECERHKSCKGVIWVGEGENGAYFKCVKQATIEEVRDNYTNYYAKK